LGALLATVGEHALPLLLLLGLGTRFAALGLLVMTAVIQLLVYPAAYPTHGAWAAVLLWLMVRGPGVVSLDHLLAARRAARALNPLGTPQWKRRHVRDRSRGRSEESLRLGQDVLPDLPASIQASHVPLIEVNAAKDARLSCAVSRIGEPMPRDATWQVGQGR
jgi:hypothetical protein